MLFTDVVEWWQGKQMSGQAQRQDVLQLQYSHPIIDSEKASRKKTKKKKPPNQKDLTTTKHTTEIREGT